MLNFYCFFLQIVGLGLRSVFELIRESRCTHPVLCTKALRALLDVLQGQTPEGLKSEPPDVIDPLFDLLLDLATLHGPESSVPNDGSHLTAIACACLLSLVVVRGDTGKFLSAVAALLMCPRALASQNIQMPAVLTSLQRSVHGVLLGKVYFYKIYYLIRIKGIIFVSRLLGRNGLLMASRIIRK